MRYIDVQWKHGSDDEPIRLVSEIDAEDYEVRKLEFYSDGSVGFACDVISSHKTFLGDAKVPQLDEINADSEFEGVSISAEEFEHLWTVNVADKY